MYFPITSGGGGQYLRMSEMNLGGAGTNGLKWLAMDACFSLYHVNWTSMKNAGVNPYNSSLHLLLGADTSTYPVPTFEKNWAQYINIGTNVAIPNPLTLRAGWYQAARDAYRVYNTLPDGVSYAALAVAGNTACRDDNIQATNSPTGSWFYETNRIWP
jgi:hypothetical protein